MTDWHGYPQHPDAHPERPWWRFGGHTDLCAELWVRVDWVERAWWSTDVPECLAAYDAAHPLPAPPPRCGQVWVWPDAETPRERMVTAVHPHIHWGGPVPAFVEVCGWPPLGAVLVYGPGAPWASMEER